jgi:hypothetical protein
MNVIDNTEPHDVPEDPGRLLILDSSGPDSVHLNLALQALREDKVVLFRNLEPERADAILRQVAGFFRLLERLDLQAAFSSMRRHRSRVGRYRMTVNARSSYQFIPPHSEGDSFIAMQLASFYSSQNSTDGGITVLVNIDDSSAAWRSLRELLIRLPRIARSPRPSELRRVTPMYHLRSPPYIEDSDTVVGECQSVIPGLRLLTALAVPRRIRSVILERDLYCYWDSIASTDRSATAAHLRVLRSSGLLKEPPGLDLARLDNTTERRIWSSGVDHTSVFRCKINHKLTRGELIIMNNLTWAHSATNWTPESGVRDVSAAFA